MKISATLSPCRTWRYRLTRAWNDNPPVAWIMLNPSSADEFRDDPTIKRCIGFSLNWGFGGIDVYNLFALRSTNPHNLVSAKDPVGPENDEWLKRIPENQIIIAAWGCFPQRLGNRDKEVLEILAGRKIECVGFSALGYPRHPLYVPYSKERENFPVSVERQCDR